MLCIMIYELRVFYLHVFTVVCTYVCTQVNTSSSLPMEKCYSGLNTFIILSIIPLSQHKRL